MSSRVKVASARPAARADQDILTAAKGGGIVFAGNLFQYASRFVIGLLLARFLGAEQLGLFNLALTSASIATGLALLGLPSAMVRFVSLFAGRRDTAGLWGTLQTGLGLTGIVSVLTGFGLFLLADPIAEGLFHEPELVHLLRIVSLVVPFLALGSVTASATYGFKKMQYAVIGQNIAQPAIRLILVLALAITVGLNATSALATFGLAVIIVFLILFRFLNSLFPLKRPVGTARRNTKEMLRFSLPVYLSSLIRVFGGNIQTLLLGALNTATTVGVFAVATQVNTIGAMFHGAIVTVSSPIVSQLYDQGEREQMGRFYQTVTKWTLTVNLPLFLIVLLFPKSILAIFGRNFVGGATALGILAWANLVKTGTGICGAVLDMTGNTSLKLVNSLVTFAATIGLNLLLIPRWGLVGAAVAALSAAAIVNLLRLLEVYILFRLLPYNWSFVRPITAGLVALTVAWGMRSLSLPGAYYVRLALSVAVLLTVYAGTILLLGLSEEDRAVLARVGQRMSAMLQK